ncbi:hypothetical protein TA3x_001690 [Tundrisphaera sp. TA3]|uniref:hypothetical protein n=1 Tax=Tundrisphaera sp. TA3 TaxID=3435775 RepID=UPI003EBB4F7D
MSGGAGVVGIVCTLISLAGAGISRAGGNRRAFEGENALEQFAWFGSMAMMVMMVVLPIVAVRYRGRVVSDLPRTDLATYQRLLDDFIVPLEDFSDRIAEAVVDDTPGATSVVFHDLNSRVAAIQARAEALPTPTRSQVEQLRGRYFDKIRTTLVRYRDAARDAGSRVPAGTPVSAGLRRIETATDQALAEYDAAPASLWYYSVFSKAAGSRSPGSSAHILPGPPRPAIPAGPSPEPATPTNEARGWRPPRPPIGRGRGLPPRPPFGPAVPGRRGENSVP